MTFILTSNAFLHMEKIPIKHSLKHGNLSPPLHWSDVPSKTQSFALIMDDLKGPLKSMYPIIHWVLYNIPSDTRTLEEGVTSKRLSELGVCQANNIFRKRSYCGPAPPLGTHHYRFRIFALDTIFTNEKINSKSQLAKHMKGHIISTAELHGLYSSSK